MAPWLPPEILLEITSFVGDISSLLSLRLVNRHWSNAAESELERWCCLSLDSAAMDRYVGQFKKKNVRSRITDAAIIVPDKDYAMSLDSTTGTMIVGDESTYASYERLGQLILKKINTLPNISRLTFTLRPPRREIAPMDPPSSFNRNSHVAACLLNFLEALRKIGRRRVANRTLKELSIQCLPAKISYSNSVHQGWSQPGFKIEQTIRWLDLNTLKLGFVGPTVWQCEDANQALTNISSFETPAVWLDGAYATLRHLSISCWGFYMKNITGDSSTRPFPKLEILELRGCAFTSRRQVEWVLKHRTLRSLTLDDCTIVYKLRLRDRNPTTEDRRNDLVFEKGGAMQEFKYTWRDFFISLPAQMNNLRQLKFGSSRIRQFDDISIYESESRVGPPLKQPAGKFLFGVFPDRYMHLQDGEDKCRWMLRPGKKSVSRPDWVKLSELGDRNALGWLCMRLQQEVIWNDTTDHAAYVVNGFGRVRRTQPDSSQQQDS